MNEYKLYFLDPEGRIRQRIDLECAGDDAAVDRARALCDRRAMALWRGPKLIKQFQAIARPAQPGPDSAGLASKR